VPKLKFTVDSALLRELGERLVGRPHIALGELIKNSYDADATAVVLDFRGGDRDELLISDNGHGMSFEAFRDYWMRVGSPHKQGRATSVTLKRRLTGSKGIGRLAAQFLATNIELTTRAIGASDELVATLDWREASSSGDLTEATVSYRVRPAEARFPDAATSGTILKMAGLQQRWTAQALELLAREIWPLQPPFGGDSPASAAFEVRLVGASDQAIRRFDEQMRALLKLWDSKIQGRLASDGDECRVDVHIDFRDGSFRDVSFDPPLCALHSLDFEIRVFKLAGRQGLGIQVEQGRDYLKQFGGVHVYDAAFHLPYYGADTDWLDIEIDHSHRLSRSQLLPDELQIQEGLNFLPTNSRLYGVVNVDTALERASANTPQSALSIQVSRDRLVDNDAYQALRYIVRWAVDYYAMQEASRELNRTEARRDVEPIAEKTKRANRAIERYRSDIPPVVYKQVRKELIGIERATAARETILERQTGLLGALATAGISALAVEHEIRKNLRSLDAIAQALEASDNPPSPAEIAANIRVWTKRVRATRRLFAPLMDTETAVKVEKYSAKVAVGEAVRAVRNLTQNVVYETGDVGSAVLLPPATMAEWFAMLQNVLLNAANATLDSDEKRVVIRTEATATRERLVIEDTGVGVDLGDASDLFQPFVRKLALTPERRYLGLGGSGLGLTIVRIIARNRKVQVRFAEPSRGFKTRFEFDWELKG
jgi:signal transduction histidine kinase